MTQMTTMKLEQVKRKSPTTARLLIALSLFLALGSGVRFAQAQDEPPLKQRHESPDTDERDNGSTREDARRRREEFRENRRNERYNRGKDSAEGEARHGSVAPDGERPGRMGRYLDMVKNYQNAVQDPFQAIGLAVLGIKDYYKRSNNPAGAVKELEELLGTTKNQKIRNIFLFGIRQVYEESHDGDKLIEINKRIIKENMAVAEGK